MKVKTRFSPSPTGFLHIGGARTALYSWLLAKKFLGSFILRIEDTDLKRNKLNSFENIIFDLSWLGLNWDKGPYFQSNRIFLYNKIINIMLSQGSAYKCFCSYKRLEQLRKDQIFLKKKPKYDGKCRNLRLFFKKSNIPCVVRFKNPRHGSVEFLDLIHGKIKFLNIELDDFIIQRSNGMPTYNFCVVVDDYHMGITHVIRGDDHINNTPRQINILKKLNAPIPQYAHVSMILDKFGKKISKRNNMTSIKEYRLQGYIPESLLNYILRLGWSFKDKEIFNLEEMKDLFTLKSLKKSPSILNNKKLNWLNNYYLKNLSISRIQKYLYFYKIQYKDFFSNIYNLKDFIKSFIHRHDTLKDFLDSYIYLYTEFDLYKIYKIKKYLSKDNSIILQYVYYYFKIQENWFQKNISYVLNKSIKKFQISYRKIAMLLRIILTGTFCTPSISLIIFYIGKNRTLKRIKKALKYILFL